MMVEVGRIDHYEEVKQRHGLDEKIQLYLDTWHHIYVPLDVIKSDLNPAIKRAAAEANQSAKGEQKREEDRGERRA